MVPSRPLSMSGSHEADNTRLLGAACREAQLPYKGCWHTQLSLRTVAVSKKGRPCLCEAGRSPANCNSRNTHDWLGLLGPQATINNS